MKPLFFYDKSHFLFVFFLCVLGWMSPIASLANDNSTVYWPFFSYPPLFIVEKDAPPSGYCSDVQDLLIKQLPEYRHVKFSAAVARMIQDVADGRHVVMVGPVKGPGREKVMMFSIPMRVSFLSHLIIRAEDFEKLGGGPDLSLREMMRNPSLTFGRMRHAAHGVANDAILGEFPAHDRTEYISGADALPRLMLMLDIGRVDFILWDPVVFAYNAKKLGYEGRFTALPVRELKSTIEAGYVVLPRNEWGQSLVKRINSILRREILSGRMFEIQSKYIPESIMERFTEAYDEFVVGPAAKDVEAQ